MQRCGLAFSLLFFSACAHKPVDSASSNGDLQERVSELQTTVRSQNRTIQDLKTQLLVLEYPVKFSGVATKKANLSGVSLADETVPEEVSVLIPPTSSKVTDETDPVKVYETSVSLLDQREYDLAFQGFSKIIKEFRKHPLSDNAYFEVGRIYIQRKESERAIFHFRQMPILYSTGDRLAEGQLILAGLLEKSGQKTESQKIFSNIAQQFSGSAAAAKARQKISKLNTKG